MLLHRPVPPLSTALDAVTVDARRPLRGGQPVADLLAAVVVDVEDVEGVDRSGDEAEDRQADVDEQIWGR